MKRIAGDGLQIFKILCLLLIVYLDLQARAIRYQPALWPKTIRADMLTVDLEDLAVAAIRNRKRPHLATAKDPDHSQEGLESTLSGVRHCCAGGQQHQAIYLLLLSYVLRSRGGKDKQHLFECFKS